MFYEEEHGNAGVSEGDILAGKYRIDKVLGVGGMGVVVAAHHLQLDERVAIKFMRVEALRNQDAVARFGREARAAVKIKSEHVCRVSDVGVLETGAPYMVMEHLEGLDLSTWLAERGPLPVEQAVDFVLQACEAIAEAHVLGIVHRDLKPANLFIIRRADGVLSLKVLDFGISKRTGLSASGSDVSDMTNTTAIMGSPLYMSPEQMRSSKGVDARADIWALGVILYELLGGQLPFCADTMPELVLKVVNTEPTPLREKRAEVPAALEAVVYRCLEKDRDRRYATVGDLAADLLAFGSRRARISVERISGILQGAGIHPSARVPSEPPRAGTTSTESNFGSSLTAGASSRTWLLVGGAVTVVALIGLGAAALVGAGRATKSVASASPVSLEGNPTAPTGGAASLSLAVSHAAPKVVPPAATAEVLLSPTAPPPPVNLQQARPLNRATRPATGPDRAKPAPAAKPAVAPPPATPSPPAASMSKPGAGLFSDRN